MVEIADALERPVDCESVSSHESVPTAVGNVLFTYPPIPLSLPFLLTWTVMLVLVSWPLDVLKL